MSKNIKKDTDEYLGENNFLQRFIEECLEITDDNNDSISSTDLFSEFKDIFPKHDMNASKFKTAMETNGIKYKKLKKGRCFIGIKYKINENQDLE